MTLKTLAKLLPPSKGVITTFESNGAGSFRYTHSDEMIRAYGGHTERCSVAQVFVLISEIKCYCKEEGIEYRIKQEGINNNST